MVGVPPGGTIGWFALLPPPLVFACDPRVEPVYTGYGWSGVFRERGLSVR